MLKLKSAKLTVGILIVTSAAAIYLIYTLCSYFNMVMYRNAFVTHRGRVHLNALRTYMEQHEALPPMLISSRSRSDFLRHAGQSFDAPGQEVTSPQYVFPLYDEEGRWFVSPRPPRGRQPAFAQIMTGIEGNHVVVVRKSGTFLRGEEGERPVALNGAQLILVSDESIWIPDHFTAQQVSQFIMDQGKH